MPYRPGLPGFEQIEYAALRMANGRVVFLPRPARHGDIIKHMIHELGLTREDVGSCVQGFMTNEERFVGRSMAWIIANDAVQLKDETIIGRIAHQLFSEDVW